MGALTQMKAKGLLTLKNISFAAMLAEEVLLHNDK